MQHHIYWQYDEFMQVGKDYGTKAQVEVYDSSHADFRDIKAESDRVLDLLKIKATDTIIDFGAGTGIFAIQAARRCTKVNAVDVSQEMIDLASTKAAQAQISNIEFHHAGFLTYQHQGQPADAIVTTFAFHHLPDFWKGIAMNRINGMLKTGGYTLHGHRLSFCSIRRKLYGFDSLQAHRSYRSGSNDGFRDGRQ